MPTVSDSKALFPTNRPFLSVVQELDKATEPWGVKVLRYEIKNINPPSDVLQAMEKQMRAEREKRATVLHSEGERDAAINMAEGEKQRVIMESEASRDREVNLAEGQAQAIRAVAEATAAGLKDVAAALQAPGGDQAMKLRIAEQWVAQFGELAKKGNTFVLPANLADVGSMIALAQGMLDGGKGKGEPPQRRAGSESRSPSQDGGSAGRAED